MYRVITLNKIYKYNPSNINFCIFTRLILFYIFYDHDIAQGMAVRASYSWKSHIFFISRSRESTKRGRATRRLIRFLKFTALVIINGVAVPQSFMLLAGHHSAAPQPVGRRHNRLVSRPPREVHRRAAHHKPDPHVKLPRLIREGINKHSMNTDRFRRMNRPLF